jgi:putative DNA methylase
LSKRKGKEVYIEPVVDRESRRYSFSVHKGKPTDGFDPGQGTVGRAGGECVLTNAPIPLDYIREQGQTGDLSFRLMAIAAEGNRERVYLAPLPEHEAAADCTPPWQPDTSLPDKALGFRVQRYGINEHRKLFSPRQLTAMATFSELVVSAMAEVRERSKDRAATGYSEALGLHLAFIVSKLADMANAFCAWEPLAQCPRHLFGKQTISMVWDFAEGNPFSSSSGSWEVLVKNQLGSLESDPMSHQRSVGGVAQQHDIANPIDFVEQPVVSTDPPYYDNIGYADLSDFFFVWLRRSLADAYPTLFSTVLTPKSSELIAAPFRHDGNMAAAKDYFESGLTKAVNNIRDNTALDAPITIYYAFKQSEVDEGGEASTGWETMLQAVIGVGLSINGTWPVRTETSSRLRGQNSNALASSIVLVCRPRDAETSIATRRDFANSLRQELPKAIKHLQSGNVAPVDLAQASIGPGMAVFSRYKQVVNADGSPMSVREALQMINQVLDESLSEQEAYFDSESRFAIRWFEQYGTQEGPFGDAETLAKAMAVSVQGIMEAGIIHSRGGKVRLLRRDELDAAWSLENDDRLTNWEVTQHLIRKLEADGETGAAELLAAVQHLKGGEYAEYARELAYRLYSTCERKDWAAEARAYNGLVVSWPEIAKLAHAMRGRPKFQQREMF